MPNPDSEEKKLLRAYEKGEWKSARPGKRSIEKYRTYARATLAKDRRVNIRLSSRDVQDLQARAMEEGIPYQTLMASVLHKFVTGRLVETPRSSPPRSKRPAGRHAAA